MKKHALLPCCLLLVSSLAALPAAARAHAVFIFGWEEGERLCTESYFNKRQKVVNGTVRVLDATGAPLAQGTTDSQGLWCTPRPVGQREVTLVTLAGEGHRGQFTLALQSALQAPSAAAGSSLTPGAPPEGKPGASTEMPGASSGTPCAPSSQVEHTAFSATVVPGSPEPPAPQGVTTVALGREELAALIRRAVQEEVAPLHRQLAAMELRATEPSLKDIGGGVGWIVGLCALASLLLRRKPMR